MRCFNGAALLQARKWNEVSRIIKDLDASMGPRSCKRGNAIRKRSNDNLLCKLQWGRALASAEMLNLYGPPSGLLSALQWGRALASAEMAKSDQYRQQLQCFNGAALLQARKYCGRVC